MRKKRNIDTEYLRPTQIGIEMIPKRTNNAVNALLQKYYFQEKVLLDNGKWVWKATEYGKQFCMYKNNTILWHKDIARTLEKLVASGKKAA